MAAHGWKQLVDGWPWFRGENSFPVLPNSEFMPPIRLGLRPYGTWDTLPLSEDDPWGWPINEYEEGLTLRPGLQDIARHLLNRLRPLWRGEEAHGISLHKLRDNPYWPADLARRAPSLTHERFVLLLPLALSITQNDKALLRWTLFGNSEQGPARAFWKGFYNAPDQEIPAEQAIEFFRTLLSRTYQEPAARLANLRDAGFRILPMHSSDADPSAKFDEPMPSWTKEFLLDEKRPVRDVKYLVTFRPFRDLPPAVKRRYFAGELHLLPCPASLLFWGVSSYQRLSKDLRFAEQIPLLHFLDRHDSMGKIRIPQSGWFEEAGANAPPRKRGVVPIRDTYQRTFRQARVHRFEDYLVNSHEHRLPHVMFSTQPRDIDLYHKPMARNVQLWTSDHQPLLDGPTASAEAIVHAAKVVAEGGLFGYRFVFPPMHVGVHEVYWHRPLVAYLDDRTQKATVIDSAPLGFLTAYRAGVPAPQGGDASAETIELWPRLLRREAHVENASLFGQLQEKPPRRTMYNVLKILDAWERNGRQPLDRMFARHLLTIAKTKTLEGWLRLLPSHAKERDRERAKHLVGLLRECLAPDKMGRSKLKTRASGTAKAPFTTEPVAANVAPLTFAHTACRSFEEAYWEAIRYLSAGKYTNKNNADCVRDHPTQVALKHLNRDLEGMGDYLLEYYASLAASRGMGDRVQVGELPFHWHTQYPFPWMGGWLFNQEGKAHERNLLVKIPGRDRSRAVVMADHYDTAYMYDRYEKIYGGTGARVAAPGADDNCSATAALMLGAHSFLDLSLQDKLDCDIWLLHLTGEEYPAEGQGACRMSQWLIEGTLALHMPGGVRLDESNVRIQGIYVLDMIAHNNDKDRGVFQIAPGNSRESFWLAQQAHLANRAWNDATVAWNRQPARQRAQRFKRCRDGATLPAISPFLPLQGEIRPHFDPRSTLFNTDGQVFSDLGIPVVLFMENYDIERVGYHDTHDNMNLIDLDYGAALAAITIETVARAATEKPTM